MLETFSRAFRGETNMYGMFRKSLVHNIGFILRLFHSLKSTSFVTYIVMDAFDKTAPAK